MTPRVLILRTAGTNCDAELAHAFQTVGGSPELAHLNALADDPARLDNFHILGLPGGFSYGDDIAAGRIMANRIRHRLIPALRCFLDAEKPVIGICNGFQVLAKAGLLPDFDPQTDQLPEQTITLADNALPRFIDRWVDARVEPNTRCIWTRGLDRFPMAVAHGEGRLQAPDPVLDRLEAAGQIAVRYENNPNGSARDIAGLCDTTGLIFGLMPHPERDVQPTHRPDWTRHPAAQPAGRRMLANAVEHVAAANASPA
jgi:phosphoribosylformylglycinamidine synthase